MISSYDSTLDNFLSKLLSSLSTSQYILDAISSLFWIVWYNSSILESNLSITSFWEFIEAFCANFEVILSFYKLSLLIHSYFVINFSIFCEFILFRFCKMVNSSLWTTSSTFSSRSSKLFFEAYIDSKKSFWLTNSSFLTQFSKFVSNTFIWKWDFLTSLAVYSNRYNFSGENCIKRLSISFFNVLTLNSKSWLINC